MVRDLVYNIDFELVAILFAILLYFQTCLCYPQKSRKNRIFRFMALMVIVTEAFDIASAFTITYGAQISRLLNLLVSTGYFMSGLLLCYLLHYYIEYAVIPSGGKPVLLKTNGIILAVLEGSMLLNCFFGYYFSISPAGAHLHFPCKTALCVVK